MTWNALDYLKKQIEFALNETTARLEDEKADRKRLEIVSTLEGRKQAYENCLEMIRDTVSVAQVERWDEKSREKGGVAGNA